MLEFNFPSPTLDQTGTSTHLQYDLLEQLELYNSMPLDDEQKLFRFTLGGLGAWPPAWGFGRGLAPFSSLVQTNQTHTNN